MEDSSSPWEESLDVDDSDLPSLLRPCKRRHNQTSQPIILTPSSPHSQTLPPLSQQSPTPPLRLIPGPAGAIQAAMLRQAQYIQNLPPEESPLSTQEYIKRAIETPEEDDEFKINPWATAIQFLVPHGGKDALIPTTPLNAVMECLNQGKVDKVVAVIKSCAPNGLGDYTVTLKDTTGVMSACIHRKVFTESEFAKCISVGSVLLLQNVSVFSPKQSAHYLVITLKSILKVFSKESGSHLRQNYYVIPVNYAPHSSENGEKFMDVDISITQEPRRNKDLMNEMIKQFGNKGSTGMHVDKSISQESRSSKNLMNETIKQYGNEGSILMNVEKSISQESRSSQNLMNGTINQYGNEGSIHMNVEKSISQESRTSEDLLSNMMRQYENKGSRVDNQKEKGNITTSTGNQNAAPAETVGLDEFELASQGNYNCASKGTNKCTKSSAAIMVEKSSGGNEAEGIDKQQKPLISLASLPTWTDEQINELFDWDCANGGSLF